MKIKILSKNDFEMSFLVEDITSDFANELRRIMTNEVPVMAIEWVDFKNNDSVVNDEMLANRAGQIPLTFDKKLYELPGECKCEGKGCSRCQVELVLKKKGPGVVYSGDLKSKNKDVKPVFDNIPIAELFEGGEITFEAIAQLDVGRKHAKWQAAAVGYRNKADIIINQKNLTNEECRKCVEKCTRKILKVSDGKLVVTDPLQCNLCMQCADNCPKGIEVVFSENSFIFNVESVSGLPPEDIVLNAAEILENKASAFEKNLGKMK